MIDILQYVYFDCRFAKQLATDHQDQWTMQENNYKFLALIQIISTFDRRDNFFCKNQETFVVNVFKTQVITSACIVEKLVRCIDYMTADRLQYFVNIVDGLIAPPHSTIPPLATLIAQSNIEMGSLLAVANSNLNALLLAQLEPRKPSPDMITMCLQICFFAVAAKNTRILTPAMLKLHRVSRTSKWLYASFTG